MNSNLPFDDPGLWEYLRINSFVSRQDRIFYVATPKVACTSLKWWFASLVGLSADNFRDTESPESDPDLVIHDTFCRLAPSVTGRRPQDLIEPITSGQYFRFAVVRNPYTRIFSAWQSKLLLREPLQSKPFENCDFFNRSIANEQDLALAYEGFLEHLLTLEEGHLDAHWKPQFSLLRPDLISYSRIGKLEDVADLSSDLSQKIRADAPKPFTEKPRNESLIPYARKFMTNRAVEIIQNLYRKDFEVFGYDDQPIAGREDFSGAELNLAIRAVGMIRGRHEQLSRGQAEIGRLTSQLDETRAELSNLKDTLARIYASRSWKITRPLRRVQRLIRNRKEIAQGVRRIPRGLVKSVRQYGLVGTIKHIVYRSGLQKRRYSGLAKAPKPFRPNSSSSAFPRKTTLVSMIKNEKSIIETFAGHALGMFDRVIFVDHRSTDATQNYLRHLASIYPQIECLEFDEEGYYQSEVMTWVVKNFIGAKDDGWVFFLDADEFLPFSSRAEFEAELERYASFPVISMPWLNLVPFEMEGGAVNGARFLLPAKAAVHHKIAFQPSLIPFDEYVVAQGNHALLVGEHFQQAFPAEQAFSIYHLPIRSKLQLSDKIRHGVESYKKMGPDRDRNLGVHWDEINQLINQKGITDELMVDMIVRYGEPLFPPYGKSISNLRKDGYSEIRLNICTVENLPHIAECGAEEVARGRSVESHEQSRATSKRGMQVALDPETNTLRFRAG